MNTLTNVYISGFKYVTITNRLKVAALPSTLAANWRKIIATLLMVTLVILAYSILTAGYEGFKDLVSWKGLASFTVLMAGWFISAVRLKYLVGKIYGYRLSLKASLKARLLGGLVANITPSAIGGEPARAAFLRKIMGKDIEELYALALYEVYYDVILVNTVALIPALLYIPVSIPVVLVASFMVTSWLSMSYFIKRNSGRSNNSLLLKISARLPAFYERFVKFSNGYREISSKIGFTGVLVLVALTIVYNTTWGLAIFFLAGGNYLLEGVIAYYFMMSMGSIPTPGGSISSEYGLSIILPPSIVVSYRTLFYYSTILIGFVVAARELAQGNG